MTGTPIYLLLILNSHLRYHSVLKVNYMGLQANLTYIESVYLSLQPILYISFATHRR
jgi:hypothetical protein